MKVRTILIVNDSITTRDQARLAAFMLKLAPRMTNPQVHIIDDHIEIRWISVEGTTVEASSMWFPMLLGCWVHIDRDLKSSDITEVHVEEIP